MVHDMRLLQVCRHQHRPHGAQDRGSTALTMPLCSLQTQTATCKAFWNAASLVALISKEGSWGKVPLADQIPFIWEDMAQPLSLRADGMQDKKTKAIPDVRLAGVLLLAKAGSGGQPGMDWNRRMALGICSTALQLAALLKTSTL